MAHKGGGSQHDGSHLEGDFHLEGVKETLNGHHICV